MVDYKVYWLSQTNKIATAEWVEAHSDDEALALIRAQKRPNDCEIWERDRLVAKVPAP